MAAPIIESGNATNTTATGAIATGPGQLLGIFVSSSSSGTVKFWDNATAGSGTVIVNTFSAAAATFYRIPASFKNGLFLTVGGTIDCSVIWTQ